MRYKHQNLFDELKLEGCPSTDLISVNIRAYRWTHDPIDHQWNFLPNILYDRSRGRPPRALEPRDLCACCNLSFFDSLEVAKAKLNYFRTRLEGKHIAHIDFYTHIAVGQIEEEDGRATNIEKGHFGFYEYEGCNFIEKFAIIEAVQ